MAQQFVGIDLGTSSVRCVVATTGFRGVHVQDVFDAEVPPCEDETDRVARTVHGLGTVVEALRSRGLERMPIGIALSGNLASTRVVRFPFADPKRIAQVLPFELEGMMPKPMMHYAFDHTTGAVKDGGVAVAVAMDRALTTAVVERCQAQEIDLRLLTTVPAALAQTQMGKVHALPESDEEGADEAELFASALVVDIGHRSTELAAVTDKGVLALRSARRGGRHLSAAFAKAYGARGGDAAEAKHDSAFLPHQGLPPLSEAQTNVAELVERNLEVIFREIEHTQIWLQNELGAGMTEIRLAGGGARIPGMLEYLNERFDVPVSLATPQVRLAGGAVPPEGWQDYCGALGACVGAARRPLVRLDDASAMERDAGSMQRQFSHLVAIGMCAVALACVDTLAKVRAFETQRDLLADELGAVTERYFGERFDTRTEIEDAVRSVDGADLTKAIPARGAMEVLQMVAVAATASDAGGAQPGVDPTAVGRPSLVAGVTPDGPVDASGALIPAGAAPAADGAAAEDGGLVMIPNDAGIVLSDALELNSVDVRERKMDLKLSATRASAQDRLAIQLEGLGCVQSITKGRIVDRNNRKVFEMIVDHNCYRENATATPEEP